jgi:hypothetical protein
MRNRFARAGRVTRYAVVFALGLALGAAALAAGSLVRTSTTGGTPVYSERPTGVGLPLVGASGTVGAGDYSSPLKDYHDSGAYKRDLQKVDGAARAYLKQRVSELRAKRSAPKPAIVLDIDETSLSNYKNLANANFTNVVGALAVGVANADDPPVAPTLRLYHLARYKNVAVFFITGRPDNIPFVRSQTAANLQSAGYKHWTGLALKPSSDATVAFKSGQRANIESQGYHIIANVGDQESDLQGGHADRAFKLPNPYYFIGP